jgi:uncharacterized Zn finger protein (UPF0148 family)
MGPRAGDGQRLAAAGSALMPARCGRCGAAMSPPDWDGDIHCLLCGHDRTVPQVEDHAARVAKGRAIVERMGGFFGPARGANHHDEGAA